MTTWQTQSQEKPLFPDLLWSRPENKKHAGKLLIIGGQANEFAHVAAIYEESQKAGAGSLRVLLPENLRKIASMIPGVEFSATNKSGGFARSALAGFLELSEWADHVLLGGDFGKNSETTVLLETYLVKNNTPITISSGSINSLDQSQYHTHVRSDTYAVLEFGQLQKLGSKLGIKQPLTSNMPAEKLANTLNEITSYNSSNIIGYFNGLLWAASAGRVSSTPGNTPDYLKVASHTAVWCMQNPTKPFEALTTACWEIQ